MTSVFDKHRDTLEHHETMMGTSRGRLAVALDLLAHGEMAIVGRLWASSNNAMLVSVTRSCPDPEPATVIDAIYKPTLGERPLDDFPDGTLSHREMAAWHGSEASGWGIVPPTVLRDGPFGEGMVQAYVEADPDVDIVAWVLEADPRLRRMAVLDAAIPMGRMAKPEEIASVVAFLADDGAGYMTATTVFADGGIMHSSSGL